MKPEERRDLYRQAATALEVRLRKLGAPSRRKRRIDHVLLGGLTTEQVRRALDDVTDGAGRELDPGKGGSPAFCSTESSAALAVNSFAAFVGRPHEDQLLSIQCGDPRFERAFPVSGVKAPVPPPLDVVLTDDERAVLVESKFLEPWRSDPKVSISRQYEPVAREISAGVAETVAAMQAGTLTFEALDAAQLLKHLFGIHGAMVDGRLPLDTTLVLLYWEPSSPANHARKFRQVENEFAHFGKLLGDQGVRLRAFSYRQLWGSWLEDGASPWLREHAAALRHRYDVPL